jgi:hypothetical protein
MVIRCPANSGAPAERVHSVQSTLRKRPFSIYDGELAASFSLSKKYLLFFDQ